MRNVKVMRWVWAGLPALGVLAANGCLAALQENLDLLLSPTAIGNAMVLPYSPVWPLFEFLLKLSRG